MLRKYNFINFRSILRQSVYVQISEQDTPFTWDFPTKVPNKYLVSSNVIHLYVLPIWTALTSSTKNIRRRIQIMQLICISQMQIPDRPDDEGSNHLRSIGKLLLKCTAIETISTYALLAWPGRHIGSGGPQNWPLQSADLTSPKFPCD